jgi:predicted MFS family arabinose efflux permease
MNPSRRLPLAALALHAADQTCLAALPLIAAVGLGAGPGMIGALIAAQGAAWLLVSLPAGAWLDRTGREAALRRALIAAGLGFLLAYMLHAHPAGLALGAFAGSGAVVVGVLAVAALVPGWTPPAGRPAANARIELARGAATLLAAPLAGACAGAGWPAAALLFAAAFATAGTWAMRGLPPRVPAMPASVARPGPHPGLARAVQEGARFAWAEPHLRALTLCAVFWNMGFFALLAVVVPLGLGPLGLTPAQVGLAMGGYGAGLMLGALVAARVLRLLPPGLVLAMGPGITLVAVALLWSGLLHPFVRLAAAQFLIGFGPMLWQVTQTTLRQAVTPSALLGRVGATLQVAVFGVRPLGALAGGALGAWAGPQAGLALATLGFALSVAMVMRRPIRGLREFPDEAILSTGGRPAHTG